MSDSCDSGKKCSPKNPFGTPIPGTDYRRRAGVYAVILSSGGHTVATIKTSRGSYFLPGGSIEAGETHADCLRRELIEETGYEASISEYIGRAEQYFISTKDEPMLSIGHFYLASLGSKMHTAVEPDHELVWMNTERIEGSLFHQHQAWAVKEALKLFKRSSL